MNEPEPGLTVIIYLLFSLISNSTWFLHKLFFVFFTSISVRITFSRFFFFLTQKKRTGSKKLIHHFQSSTSETERECLRIKQWLRISSRIRTKPSLICGFMQWAHDIHTCIHAARTHSLKLQHLSLSSPDIKLFFKLETNTTRQSIYWEDV